MKHTHINRTPQRERDKWFDGWEEFSKLSNGIMEEEEEEEPDSILLAVPPVTYDATADDREPELEEKKNPKPDCLPGNPSHSASTGKFSKKTNAGSWSKGPHKGSEKDCKHGSRRSKGRWTKVACGRKKIDGKPDPKGNKADHRCHDGKKVREQRAKQALDKLTQVEAAALITEVVRLTLSSQSQPLTEGKREQLVSACKGAGMYSMEFFFDLQDKMSRSSEGKLSGE